ncbi:MAG: phage portal protein [Clostridia bacterium]|nr:phage portal protein [Clostridia bacterium]
MITRNRSCARGDTVDAATLRGVLDEHAAHAERLKKLKRYYLGETDIVKRRRAPGLPNNRISHAFARYIVTVSVGYLVGESVGYKTDTDQKAALDEVLAAYRECDAAAVDTENARNAAIYGRGIEFICVPERGGLPGAYALSPENAFVVYTDDICHEPLFGVYMGRSAGEGGAEGGMQIICATESRILEYSLRDGEIRLTGSRPHFFDGVPMVEYWNDENEKGDFEWIIPLIDAYDALQSDRLNDKDQFADKLLVLTGCTLETDEEGRPPWLQLRMDKALCLPDGDAKASYLTGEMNESGNEILRKSLCEDIHKLSLVPDLSDTNFAGNMSGVAMKYKLMGLEQLAGMKQQWFTEGLRRRLRLFAGFMRLRGTPKLDAARVSVTYTRALPENLSEAASAVKTAREAGAMSTRTMVELLHGNGDWNEEMTEREVERIYAEGSGRTGEKRNAEGR